MTSRSQRVERWSTIAWPLGWSFAAVAWAMVLVCRFALGSTLTRQSLVLFSLICLVLIAGIHALVVLVVRGIMDRGEPERRSLLCGVWLPVVWIPPLVVLGTDRSAWVALLLMVIAAWTVALRRGWWRGAQADALLEGELQGLFAVPAEATLGQTIFPVVLTSVAAQLGVLALIARKDWLAGGFLALASLLPVWRFPRREDALLKSLERKAAGNSVVALMLMMLALVPFLKPGPGHAALESLLEIARAGAAISKAHPLSTSLGAGYPGIILHLPPKPHEAVLPPAPESATGMGKVKPIVIPFDGAYWFFKEPDARPKRDAKVVQGDPLKAHIRSTNELALQMEAHQLVLPSVPLSCCSTLQVDVTNAETEPGKLAVEVLLGDAGKVASDHVSLGTVQLTSSATVTTEPLRQPIHETLTFSVPRRLRAGEFSEITVRIKAAPGRERVGSRVSVDSFVLTP